MTMHNTLHPRDDRNNMCHEIKAEEDANIEFSVGISMKGLEDNIKKKKEVLIIVANNSTKITMDKQNNNNWEIKMGRKTTVWKLVKFHTRKPGHDFEREISREKLNLF